MPDNKKLFPGVSQKQVEEKDRAEKLRQAQESLADAARQEQAKKDAAPLLVTGSFYLVAEVKKFLQEASNF